MADGVIAYVSLDRIYVNFMFNGIYKQAVYGNVIGNVSMRDTVWRGDVIGQMLPHSGRYLLELTIRETAGWQVANGNFTLVNPAPLFDLSGMTSDFLHLPMSNFFSFYADGVSPQGLSFQPFVAFQEPTCPHIRYAENLDLEHGEVYLRKLVEMLFYRHNLAEQGYTMQYVLQWNRADGTIAVNIFGESHLFVPPGMCEDEASINHDNATVHRYSRVVNSRTVINVESFNLPEGYYLPEDAVWIVYFNEIGNTRLYVTYEAVASFGSFTDVFIGIIREMDYEYGRYGDVFVLFYDDEWVFVGELTFAMPEARHGAISPALLLPGRWREIGGTVRNVYDDIPANHTQLGQFRDIERYHISHRMDWIMFVDTISGAQLFITARPVPQFGNHQYVFVGVSRANAAYALGRTSISRNDTLWNWETHHRIFRFNVNYVEQFRLNWAHEYNALAVVEVLQGNHPNLTNFIWHTLGEHILNNLSMYEHDYVRARSRLADFFVFMGAGVRNNVELALGFVMECADFMYDFGIGIINLVNRPQDVIAEIFEMIDAMSLFAAELIAFNISLEELGLIFDVISDGLDALFEDIFWLMDNYHLFFPPHFQRLSPAEARDLGRRTAGALISLIPIAGGYKTGAAVFRSAKQKVVAFRAGFGNLSRASEFGIRPYTALRRELQRTTGLQAHHLIEVRFNKPIDLAVAVTPAEHQIFTNAWRRNFPLSNQIGHIPYDTITPIQLWAAAQDVYEGFPSLLEAVRIALGF